jgi:lysophospholipase-2
MAASHKVVRNSDSGSISFIPEKYDSLIVISHGLGDSAEGFADVANMFSQNASMARVKFILPTAPLQPVTMNGGMRMNSWYDIVSLESKDRDKCHGIEQSKKYIEGILDEEHQKHGVEYNRMILSGFSQGGAMSLFTGMQLSDEKKLAGILCMSGYLASHQTFRLNASLADTPILHCHGTSDPLVQYKWALLTKESLIKSGATGYQLRPFQGMEHTVSTEELQEAFLFIQKCLDPSVCPGKNVVPKKKFEEMSSSELKAAIKTAGLGKSAVGLLEKKELVDLLNAHKGL